jgi:hypothetical protein
MTEGYVNTTPISRWTHPLFGVAKPWDMPDTTTPFYDSLVAELGDPCTPLARTWRPADILLGRPKAVTSQVISGVVVNRP